MPGNLTIQTAKFGARMNPVLLAALIGLAVGVVVGALGAGGGILSVLILVYALGQSPHSAAASSLVIVGATAVAGMLHHLRRRSIDWPHGLAFGLLGVAGSFAGSRLSARVDGGLLMALFAIMLAGVSIAMFIKAAVSRREEEQAGSPAAARPHRVEDPSRRKTIGKWVRIIVLATLTGVLTGFFGVGGGFIVVPILVLVMGLPMRTASGTSLVVMVIAATSGLVSRIGTHVVIDWWLTLAFTAASMVGGLLGGPVANRVRASVLTLIFAVLLATVAVFIGVQAVSGGA